MNLDTPVVLEERTIMKNFYLIPLLVGGVCVFLLFSCAEAPSRVIRVDPEQQVDLSGKWNDTDSQMVSDEMIAACMTAPWTGNYIDASGKLPVMVVGTVFNKTDEHISADVFIKDLERAFVESNRAKVVQGGAALDEIRAMRQEQQDFASPETRHYLRNELGADFVLQGVINKIVDIDANRRVYFYQVDLELTDIESAEKIWIGQKKLKKYVEKNSYGF